jgi:uncharacterized membrane protein YphA (DoxX/SURF4 family)
MSELPTALSLLLAGVFVAAGITKLRRPDAVSATLHTLGVRNKSLRRVTARLLAIGELGIGFWLVSGVALEEAALLAGAVLIVFTGLLLVLRSLSGTNTVSCGCFGESSADWGVWWGIARNVLLVAPAVVVAVDPDRTVDGSLVPAGLVAAGLIALHNLVRTAVTERQHLFAGPPVERRA